MIARKYEHRETEAQALVANFGTKPFSPQVEEDALKAIAEGLRATKWVRQRDKDGRTINVEVPDHALRGALGVKVIEHNIGKPLQRSAHADLTPPGASNDDGGAFWRALLDDPDARASLRATAIQMADTADRLKPVDVIATAGKLDFGGKPEYPSAASKR